MVRVDALSDPERRDVVFDVVAHESDPTTSDLEYSTGFDHDRLQSHLDALMSAEVVDHVDTGEEDRYALTPGARDVFDTNSVFNEDHLQELYSRVDTDA